MDPKTNGVQGGKDGVQGEGNYDATRRYDEGVKKSVDKGHTEELEEKGKAGEPATDDKSGASKPASK